MAKNLMQNLWCSKRCGAVERKLVTVSALNLMPLYLYSSTPPSQSIGVMEYSY
uniref:Uncharacterized protein n=1 Tax=Daucus carota subsp. sativus TaxID=79200 RepID=A0A166ECU5_DAUCS